MVTQRPAPALKTSAPFLAEEAAQPVDLETRTFFISRVSALNVLLKRRAAIYAKRTFGMTLIEWRIITLLPTLQPISIRELAVHALVDAAQVSRGISRLVGKNLLSRRQSNVDSREALIVLTPEGMALSIEMFNASLKRNDQLLREHTPKEVDFLNAALDALIVRARNLVGEDDAREALKQKAARKPRSARP
jgi:DNA-binding MarR family transcriptional regulator